MTHDPIIEELQRSEPERRRERARSHAILSHADRTTRRIHSEASELMTLLSGRRMRNEVAGVESTLRTRPGREKE